MCARTRTCVQLRSHKYFRKDNRADLESRLAETRSNIFSQSFENELFKVSEIQPSYFGCVAKRRIPHGTVLLVEPVLLEYDPSAKFTDQTFVSGAGAQQLLRQARDAVTGGTDTLPAEAAETLERLAELYLSRHVAPKLDSPQRLRIMALQDEFRQPMRGSLVRIEGLQSEAGRQLNGKDGIAIVYTHPSCKTQRYSEGARW